MDSDHDKYYDKCKVFGNSCRWLIWITLRQQKGIWELRWYNGPHTCLATSISCDYRKLDYHVIFSYILPMIRTDTAVSIMVLQNTTEAHFGFGFTYRRITIPDSIAVLRMIHVRFEGQDGNSNIIPITFALVDGENAKSWSFFLSHLCKHETPQPDILVIFDRHNWIKATLEAPDDGWVAPVAYRAFCIRHVTANFAMSFKGKDARRILVNATYAKTEVEFDYWFDILQTEDLATCD
ncbi:uncharacterized protein LOC110272014 [Arachis ipaensis]|uniref:uncharacterized protein LOC110272014 n=1 Tax=Arachis ipaensis TaxID=130454 RepID=UPI000A2B288B|nr:uncharacterized protein LOC110272014 [Arachis ipaensis]